MRAILLFFFALVLVVTTGCMQEMPPPANPAPSYPASTGRRVIIEGAYGLDDIKVRKRRGQYKVYDAARRPLGIVGWQGADAASPVIELRSFDGARHERYAVSEADTAADAFDLGDSLRLERVDRGWAIFDAEANLLAIIDHFDEEGGDKTWRMRKSYTDRESWVAVVEDGQMKLRHGTRTMRSWPADLFSPTGALAMGIAGLDPLEAVALATWLTLHLQDR